MPACDLTRTARAKVLSMIILQLPLHWQKDQRSFSHD